MCSEKKNDFISGIDSDMFKSLFNTKPHVHASAMIYNWTIIFLSIYLYNLAAVWWTYPIVVIIIGAKMHGLAILMHDATHYRFLKNRKWNDVLSNLLIMYPIFTSIEEYRANHLRHHQHLNTDDDPDWVAKLTKREFSFPKTKKQFIFSLASYLVFYQGLLDTVWILKRMKSGNSLKSSKKKYAISKWIFYISIACLLTFFELWYFYMFFWIIPYLTSFFMFQYIRSVAEHFGDLAYKDDLSSTRTVIPTILEKFFIAPHSVGYHLEHHLYPGVPFYNLSKLHSLLMTQEPYNKNAHITKGYLSGLMLELGK